jgi:iron complex outermembrane receptor protein
MSVAILLLFNNQTISMLHNRYVTAVLVFACTFPLPAQEVDSIKTVNLDEVVVTSSFQRQINRNSTSTIHLADRKFLDEHFTGNLMQTLEYMPGIRSMDIGSGFSKPVIRGLGFNRIVVTENGVKHEGQQWGVDHGLETDAFNTERVVVRKGPASLLYGSDAMGGAIEIMRLPPPDENQVAGEVALLGKSVNATLGGSLKIGIKKDAWYVDMRFSEQHSGDYRIPADTVVYLTQRMPVAGRRLKNTAGFERDISLYSVYKKGAWHSDYLVGNTFQKVGFFPGAHGIPDVSRLEDDGDSRNIALPYSAVNHLKLITRQQYLFDKLLVKLDLGFQRNHREEQSLFHTHYGNQTAPEKEPDKELDFRIHTFSTSLKADWFVAERWKHTFGWDFQYQDNRIAGYSFLLPAYSRLTAGGLWLSVFRPTDKISVSGGIRFDYGKLDISAFRDGYLEEYLSERSYPETVIDAYKWRSYPVDRYFDDLSYSLGIVFEINDFSQMKANMGRSFRLPGANELASNGVHHGAFRHERGEPSLASERGWQLDVSYVYNPESIGFSVSPFFNWFDNYIYLKPTGEWSLLPHAGQIYRYTGTKAVFAGAEAEFHVDFLPCLTYRLQGEYVYTYNVDEHTPVSFSPPASISNALTGRMKSVRLSAELQTIADQNRVARNEDRTQGANLFNLSVSIELPMGGILSLSARNLFNTAYFNHLSFYRKAEIPEPGRNIQLFIKIPFKFSIQ